MTNIATLPAPRNAWYLGAWSNEVTEKPLARTILDENVVLYRQPGSKAAALEDRCSHRATPLSLGDVTDRGLQCGYHGLTFNSKGECVFIPGQESIPPQACVRSYPVVERQGFVWIWTGDPEQADANHPTLIDYPWNDDTENWPTHYGYMHIKCNYMLLNDNLMDLTHIPFIHRRTIGGGNQMGQVNAEMKTRKTPTGVHYIRWMDKIQPPPTYVKAAGFAADAKVDRWQEFEYIAPITVLQWTGALESGRGARENREQDGGFQLRIYHGATPETDSSCHYFFTCNNGCTTQSEADNDRLFREIRDTFLEDLEFLENQQACLEDDPTRALVDIKHDTARIHARRTIDRMLAEEEGHLAVAAS
ncbi:MAG: aromatic ring-hydroxylating dioxygenase subunit alpha [Rhodospirillaceae bacterium]|nr:aromatic ring-hydroxylating dioxygenase subunit alpha [Rhodospirillaceae bacterium]